MATNIHFHQIEKTDVESVFWYEHEGRPFWTQMITMHFSDGSTQAIKLFSDAAPESLIAVSGKSESHDGMLQALRRAALALAFAAESSPAMKDDYNAVSAAIAQATEAA